MSVIINYRRFLKVATKLFSISPIVGQYQLKVGLSYREKIRQAKQSQRQYQKLKMQNTDQKLILKTYKLLKFNQKKVEQFSQIIELMTQIMQNSLNFNLKQMDRYNYQKKIIRLVTNSSQFVSNQFKFRDQFVIKQIKQLENDIQYQSLNQKEKQFVKNMISRVCCGKRGQIEYGYINIQAYLKDYNSQKKEKQKVIIFSKSKYLLKKQKANQNLPQNNLSKIEEQHSVQQKIKKKHYFDEDAVFNLLYKKTPSMKFKDDYYTCLGVIQKTMLSSQNINKNIQSKKQFKQAKKQFSTNLQEYLLDQEVQKSKKLPDFIIQFLDSKVIWI